LKLLLFSLYSLDGTVMYISPGVAVNGQQVLEMAATGHPNSVIVGDVVLSMTSLRSDVTRYVIPPTTCLNRKMVVLATITYVVNWTSFTYCQDGKDDPTARNRDNFTGLDYLWSLKVIRNATGCYVPYSPTIVVTVSLHCNFVTL